MPSAEYHLGFDDRLFLALGIPTMGLLIPVVFGGIYFDSGALYWISAAFSTGYAALYWFAARFLMIRLHRRYPEAEELRERVWRLAALFIPFILVICGLSDWLIPAPSGVAPMSFLQNVLMSAILTMSVAGVYESIYLLHRYRQGQLEREQLQREKVQTELDALRNQVNPHFLFNSLNTLADLISEDPRSAESYVQELSRVYRYVLEIQNRELIRLEEELQFLHSYLFLQRTRFGDKLQVQLDIGPEWLNWRIIPLSLQLLLENAIKHNVVSADKPLHIAIQSAPDAMLSIRNNLQLRTVGAGEAERSTKRGLENLRNRYSLLNQRAPEVVETDTQFEVRLPLLQAGLRPSTSKPDNPAMDAAFAT